MVELIKNCNSEAPELFAVKSC